MKLTATCPKCGATFDEGLVAEVGAETLDSVDLCEFEGQKYTCKSCGHQATIKDVEAKDENGFHICV